MPATLKTQSQPFQIRQPSPGGGIMDDNYQDMNVKDIEGHCSCDSILSRLIYGYNITRRTMESLHPNVAPIQIGAIT